LNTKLQKIIDDSYLGEIVSIDDDKMIGRCKIMVFGVYKDSTSEIPKDKLPNAYPHLELGFGKGGASKFETPEIGTIVNVVFDKDIYHPKYFSVEDLDEDLVAEIKENGYEGFKSLWFQKSDELKLYYSRKTGILMHLDGSYLNILPDNSIIVSNKDSNTIFELREGVFTLVAADDINMSSDKTATINTNTSHLNSKTTNLGNKPVFSNTNGEIMMLLLKAVAKIVDTKYPVTPGLTAELVNGLEEQILSGNVKVSP
jgi:hypothetical protein